MTENSVLVEVVNWQTSKNKLIMLLVRDLVLTLLKYSTLFRMWHIAGINNSLADLWNSELWNSSNKLFRRRTKCQLKCQTAFRWKAGCFPERSAFLSPACGIAEVVLANLESILSLLPLIPVPSSISTSDYSNYNCAFYITCTRTQTGHVDNYLFSISLQLFSQIEGLTWPN